MNEESIPNIKVIGKVTIIGNGPEVGQGRTQVLVDGVPLRCVTRVELVADAQDVWRAVIYLIPNKIEVTDIDTIEYREFARIKKNHHEPVTQRLKRLAASLVLPRIRA